MNVQAYLFFDGRCEEALEFYKKSLGAQVIHLSRYRENPEPEGQERLPPGSGDKIMHVSVRIGDSTVMMSDGHCMGRPKFEGFAVTLSVSTDAEAERYFSALMQGGEVGMPLKKTFFASRFGMLRDRFGVHWMVIAGS